MLLAKALGFIHEGPNPATGANEVLLLTKDADGFDSDPVLLGTSFVASADSVNLNQLHTIQTVCNAALVSADYRHQEQRSALQRALLADVEAIKVQCGGNIQDPTYRRFLDAGKRAVALLKGEATA